MDNYWYKLGQDAARAGVPLQDALNECETSAQQYYVTSGYMAYRTGQ